MQRQGFHRELDEVRLENLEVRCVVGIYPREKVEPQPVIVNLMMFLDTRRAGRHVSLRDTIDYAAVAGEIRFVLEHSHFRLLETAADALSHLLLAPGPKDQPRAQPEALELQLKKPAALGGGTMASVTVRRTRAEVITKTLATSIGPLEVLHQSADCSLYRITVPAGGETALFQHETSEGAEMPLSDGLVVQGIPVSSGEGHVWPARFPRRYGNPNKADRSILAVLRGDVAGFTCLDKDGKDGAGVPRGESRMYYPDVLSTTQHFQ